MKKILSIITIALLCCGCITKKAELNISTVYPFEGRYDNSANIIVNGDKIIFDKKDSVWLLSNKTLFNLLVDVSKSTDKIIFKGTKSDIVSQKAELLAAQAWEDAKDEFESEDYVWDKENWTQSGVGTVRVDLLEVDADKE